MQAALEDFANSPSLEPRPYEVPHESGRENTARTAHREWYWTLFDYDSYECPDCGRSAEDVRRFEVHHLDRDPLNGALWNLQAVCKRCHGWRHGQRDDLSGLSVEEWKEAFVDDSFSAVY
jgi:5-methylcytosine-specific restriction endonuclease McrA